MIDMIQNISVDKDFHELLPAIGTLHIYDSNGEDDALEKCVSFLLWNFSFI